jgi:hypothetical protein
MARAIAENLGAQVHVLDRFPHPRIDVSVVAAALIRGQPELYVLSGGQRVEQRRVLEDIADAGSYLPDLPSVCPRHGHSLNEDFSFVGVEQTHDVLQEHALPGARGTHDHHARALRDVQVHSVQDPLAVQLLAKAPDLDHCTAL